MVTAWVMVVLLAGSVAALVLTALRGEQELGDPGRLSETLHDWTAQDGALPVLVEATAEWGLTGVVTTGSHPLRGGAAIADIDDDGRNDLAIAGGRLHILMARADGGFEPVSSTGSLLSRNNTGEAVSVALSDVDGDGRVDILVGTDGDLSLVVWGGDWSSVGGSHDVGSAQVTLIPGGRPTTALVPADLDGDGVTDLLRLGYGGVDPRPDLILRQDPADRRTFDTGTELPDSRRLSLAAEIADVDGDGLVDLWVTRDTGWATGPDSVYSRSGDPSGPWRDIAPGLGADQAIDGMGITVGDLTGDGSLDFYLSDLGDNELLTPSVTGRGFVPVFGAGTGRIRPPGASESEVSSSWGSGLADLNLDGRFDLVVVNGGFVDNSMINKIPGSEVVLDDPPAIYLGLGEGLYADVWARLGLPWEGSSRGLAIGDLDSDGDPDLVIVNHRGQVRVYRNDTPTPGVTMRLEPGCRADGAILRLESAEGSAAVRVGGRSFAGHHAAEVSLPRDSGRRSTTIVVPGRAPVEVPPPPVAGPPVVVLPCP